MEDRVAIESSLSSKFGSKAEELVVAQGQCPTGDRNTPIMAYWSLAFEFHKAILNLIAERLYGAAFALVRPLIEATIRSHLVIFISEEKLNPNTLVPGHSMSRDGCLTSHSIRLGANPNSFFAFAFDAPRKRSA